ncbi:MAG: hypothetical protein Q8N08_06835 [Methanobacteriaceae archaeon]|nr:hypothetical protein [Methanobacteriaceae archaeon]
MDQTKKESADEILKSLKEHYPQVIEVVWEDENTFCAYADDDTLWKMYDELARVFKSVEFNSGDQDQNYVRIVF